MHHMRFISYSLVTQWKRKINKCERSFKVNEVEMKEGDKI